MIRPTDRLSAVLARDERLLDVLVSAAPAFRRLHNASLRKHMAPRVTLEQAARIARIDVNALVDRLNQALADRPPEAIPLEPERTEAAPTPVPDYLREIPAERLVDVDVRDELRAGIEPFGRIMGAARRLGPEQVLRVRAIFEPVPLYGVFAKKGFAHFTERLAPDDWRVWFFRQGEPSTFEPSSAPGELEAGGDDVIVLDVRGLEPPEPMIRTFEALATLPRGKTLVQINVRVPQFLLPRLDEQGFVYEIREQSADLVRLFIRHKPD